MADTAAHLADRVFPIVPVRQWALSLPLRPALPHGLRNRSHQRSVEGFHSRSIRRIASARFRTGGYSFLTVWRRYICATFRRCPEPDENQVRGSVAARSESVSTSLRDIRTLHFELGFQCQRRNSSGPSCTVAIFTLLASSSTKICPSINDRCSPRHEILEAPNVE